MKISLKFKAAFLLCILCMPNFCGCVHFANESETVGSIPQSTSQSADKAEVLRHSDDTSARVRHKMQNNLDGFEIIYQNPELPTGCEITSLAMVLNYCGFEADKCILANDYLPTLPSSDIHCGKDGLLHGNDINRYFIGDPADLNGTVCGSKAIADAAKQYLDDFDNGEFIVRDMTGENVRKLYNLVENEIPVIVWCTVNMSQRHEVEGWYNDSGKYVSWAHEDHCAVLIGCGEDSVTIADPISGITEYDKEQFESSFKSRGRQCVVIYN